MNNILNVLDKVIEGMKKEIDCLKERNNELFKEVSTFEEEIIYLKSKNNNSLKDLDKLIVENEMLRKDLKELSKEHFKK